MPEIIPSTSLGALADASTRATPFGKTRGGMTLEEIADALDVTRERTRQIESAALAQLRRALKMRGIEGVNALI